MNEFWDSWAGRELWWRQRWLRTRRLRLEGEPRQKRTRGARQHAADAQQKLLEQLMPFRHGVLTGPVALDLDFHVTVDQPPALYNLAKYLLDVLGPTQSAGQTLGRRHVLYRDDRQVKLLYVRLRHASISDPTTTSSGEIWLSARPLRDVVEDLRLARKVEDCTDSIATWPDEEESPFFQPEIPHVERVPTFDLGQATSTEEARRWEELNSWLAFHDRSRLQEAILRRTDANVAFVLSQSPESLAGARPRQRPFADTAALRSIYDKLDKLRAENREMLLSSPLAIPMPSLPRVSGERQTFKTAIRRELEQWLACWPVFHTLLVPLKVTFLVMAPAQGHKDLDNIALEVLPIVHEVLQPQPDEWLLRSPPPGTGERAEADQALNRLRVLRDYSVTAFEVIELKRRNDDPPAGLLYLALGSGSQVGSIWTRITDYVEDYMDNI